MSNFICDDIPTKAILFFFSCSEVNTWLITSELANQPARKLLFTCLVYTNIIDIAQDEFNYLIKYVEYVKKRFLLTYNAQTFSTSCLGTG